MISKEAEEAKLLSRYESQVRAFRQLCENHGNHPCFEETDFFDFSVGFFIALGVDGTADGEIYLDAFRLASLCRYRLQYWEKAA